VIAGGHLLDPARKLNGPGWVAVAGERITAIGTDSVAPRGRRRIDVSGSLVTPGLIDLHTHLYTGVSYLGVDADAHCLRRGVTTAVDAGSAGAQTFAGFRRLVIERSKTRILAFLNIATAGMISPLVGELEDLRWASVEDAVACGRANQSVIAGIKVRLGRQVVGQNVIPALRLARSAADELRVPLMVHVTDLPVPIPTILSHLTEGDVITHCFHGREGGILDGTGRVFHEVVAARQRGVLFDVGHGVGSFAFRVAAAALEQGFPPSSISSDLHTLNVNGPVFDQVTTMSKLLHLGVRLEDVIRMATASPAAALRASPVIGGLETGREADLTIMKLQPGSWDLSDADGQHITAERLLVPEWTVRCGKAVRARSA
jgi:dihydroorotase